MAGTSSVVKNVQSALRVKIYTTRIFSVNSKIFRSLPVRETSWWVRRNRRLRHVESTKMVYVYPCHFFFWELRNRDLRYLVFFSQEILWYFTLSVFSNKIRNVDKLLPFAVFRFVANILNFLYVPCRGFKYFYVERSCNNFIN